MTTMTNSKLSEQTSAIASALIQSGKQDTQHEAVYVTGTRPGESEEEAGRRAVIVHDKAIQRSLGDQVTADWPRWLQVDYLSRLEQVDTISAAMDRYYKPDRLNQPGGMRETLIRSRQRDFVAQGWAILASHHDAINGHGLYLRKEAGAIVLYMSNK
ncbi:hypothetical protein [Massilia sp. LjRoot122]|uniref:hypothetical protein n=1 Tax=Massilia sp. LjRoot122 TaxID=3342257 RepID=UPI003ECFBC40